MIYFQVQDKFVLHLNDEEAVHYMQNLIEISVTAVMAALMENIHKMAQVCVTLYLKHVLDIFLLDMT